MSNTNILKCKKQTNNSKSCFHNCRRYGCIAFETQFDISPSQFWNLFLFYGMIWHFFFMRMVFLQRQTIALNLFFIKTKKIWWF